SRSAGIAGRMLGMGGSLVSGNGANSFQHNRMTGGLTVNYHNDIIVLPLSLEDRAVIRETERKVASGGLMLTVLLLGTVATIYGFISAIRTEAVPTLLLSLGALVLLTILWFGLFTVQPNQSRVLQLFGDY